MRAKKVITIITIILLVVIITLASFLGIYKKEEYRVYNKVPDYILGMEFTGCRVINLEVDKERNSGETLTIENYNKAKTIIKSRLKGLNVDQFKVDLNKDTGNIQVKIQENENADSVIYYLLQSGTFELKDSETEEVLLDTNAVKDVNVVYSQGENQTVVYLQIEFSKEGKQKLSELSKIYSVTGETENTSEENNTTNKLDLYLSEEKITEIDLEKMVMNEMLYIGVGAASDAESLEQYKIKAEEAKTIIKSGILPIKYLETDSVESAKITNEQIKIGAFVAIGVIVLMTILFIITLRLKGILASILHIGYIALLLLTLRYTNVKITIEGIVGITIGTIINFVYLYLAFKNTNLNFVNDVTKRFAIVLIPAYVLAVIFSFNKLSNIYSLGMTLVWSFIVMYIYNLVLTQISLKNINK